MTVTCSLFLHEWILFCYDCSQISELFHSFKGFITLETQICVKKIQLNLPGSWTNKSTSSTECLIYDSTRNFVEHINFTTVNPLHYSLHSHIQKNQNYETISSISIQESSTFNYFQSMERGTSWSKALTAFFFLIDINWMDGQILKLIPHLQKPCSRLKIHTLDRHEAVFETF